MRDMGGIYWLPEAGVDVWKQVAAAVEGASEKAGSNSVYMLTTVMDDAAIRAVKDAITHEIAGEAIRVHGEVTEGLGDRATENRKERMKELHSRVSHYEGLLEESLESLHNTISVVEQAMTFDAMQEFGGLVREETNVNVG